MNLKNRPYSVYAHSKKDEREGLWFRVRSFKTMSDALISLKELTKTPKEERDLIYIVLPNNGEQRRHILFKEEHIKNVLETAK